MASLCLVECYDNVGNHDDINEKGRHNYNDKDDEENDDDNDDDDEFDDDDDEDDDDEGVMMMMMMINIMRIMCPMILMTCCTQ